ncbi:DegT/DnrJ/EryC1/StrS family aminotransferase [Roseomonas fluvialis]|uniref:Pyridoxal phosphate-dependent aminotransferase EpsN n=1 Tax=Roseomonas fluvialis TaxID=1750527 RepID=A0ABN6P805_9PROT|nr:DegT/DnrJ/EryC1/StrS family aminotransferase [Roseomonas fluvialis]BDG74977.1 putative pyridoxal phosphate-dependent aminotransferase EpsN [Roseomonas fluvialis]
MVNYLVSSRPPPTPPNIGERGAGRRIHLSAPHLAGDELDRLRQVLESGWVAPAGPTIAAFEAAIGAATGFPHVLATSSGTAALHLAYRVLDIGPGDEVWAPGFTFVATVAPAVQMGAVPRFLDVCPKSWTLDPGLLRAELRAASRRGRLPRVVVAVDIYGQASELDAILAACARYDVPVLSDSAEGLGAIACGRPAGRGARVAAFSFNGNKIVTAGGGGALATDDPVLLARARHLASHAKDPAPHYQHSATGHAYGLSSVLAAVGLAQVAVLPQRVAARRGIFARYAAALADLPGLAPMPEPRWGRSTHWLSAILVDPARAGTNRDRVRIALEEAGAECRPVWKPLPEQPVFRDAPRAGGAVARGLFAQGLCLPSGTGMTVADQDLVIDAIRGCWRA